MDDLLLSGRLSRRQVLRTAAAAGLLTVAGGLARLERLLAAPAGGRWRRLSLRAAPGPRFAPAMAYDAARRVVVLFSGEIRGAAEADTWIWNGRTWAPQSVAAPPPRSRACFAYYPPTRSLVLFGGGNQDGFLSDTWTWNGRSWRQAAEGGPPARAGAVMAFDRHTESLILFGGYGDRMLNDTWAWTGASWRQLSPEQRPPAIRGAAMAYSAALARLVMFGGSYLQGSTKATGETWVWDGRTWASLYGNSTPPEGALPQARRYASMAADPDGRAVLLFGGFDEFGALGDTWTFATGWLPDASAGPPRRAGAGLALDPSGTAFVLFGGGDGRSFLGDTWLWGPFA